MERISPSELARSKSAIARRYVTINGRNSSVCLESAFWDALKEIADIRGTTRATIVSTIESEGRPRNLSSAIRVLVLDHYRSKIDSHQTLVITQSSSHSSRARISTQMETAAGDGAQVANVALEP
jgi:predicted DNA-binding ribbon-helix-helix protein